MRTAALAIFVISTYPACAGQASEARPIKTTLCDVLTHPDDFNGKMIEIRARVRTGFEHSGISDESCGKGTWLAFTDRPLLDDAGRKPVPLQFAYIKSRSDMKHPDRLNWWTVGTPPVTRLDDEAMDRLSQYLRECYDKKCFCPKNRVIATVIGRLDYIARDRLVAMRNATTGRVELWRTATGSGTSMSIRPKSS